MIACNSVPPFYVATHNGFLVIEQIPHGRTRVYTTQDVRNATVFHTFDQADGAAKWGVNTLFPPDLNYFAILSVPEHAMLPDHQETQPCPTPLDGQSLSP